MKKILLALCLFAAACGLSSFQAAANAGDSIVASLRESRLQEERRKWRRPGFAVQSPSNAQTTEPVTDDKQTVIRSVKL